MIHTTDIDNLSYRLVIVLVITHIIYHIEAAHIMHHKHMWPPVKCHKIVCGIYSIVHTLHHSLELKYFLKSFIIF